MKFDVDRTTLTAREVTVLKLLEAQYTPQIANEVLVPLITQESPVSLRILDWCVTNWSKKHNVMCASQVPGKFVNIHHSYRSMLSFWRRKLFDPFRRRTRVLLRIEDREYETTLGQANFALWAHQTGVMAYVVSHLAEIERDMNAVSGTQKRVRRETYMREGKASKRKELTSAPRSLCVAYLTHSRVSFDEIG